MSIPPKTVLVKHADFPDGILINADDFDPAQHKLVDLDVAIPDAEKPEHTESDSE
ncbi:MAG TPA: hypothetical protein PLT25_06260 [Acidocella sp.]|nr:hypothetical protein [Acidocella sp.]